MGYFVYNEDEKFWDRRYHEEIYMPPGLQERCMQIIKKNAPHHFTNHAWNNKDDRSHNADKNQVKKALEYLENCPSKPFEIYVNEKGYPFRFCMRTKLNPTDDIAFVLQGNKVITFWVNETNDDHRTLKYWLYDKD